MQYNITGLPITIAESDVVKFYPTSDGSFFLFWSNSTIPVLTALFHIKKIGESFEVVETIESLSAPTGTNYPKYRVHPAEPEHFGYIQGAASCIILKTVQTSSSVSTIYFITLNLEGSGSYSRVGSMVHNHGVAVYPASNRYYCINSLRSSMALLLGDNLYEYDLTTGTLGTPLPLNLGTVAASIFYGGNGDVWYLSGGTQHLRATITGPVPSAYVKVNWNTIGAGAGYYYGIQLGDSWYKIALSGTTRTFIRGFVTADNFTRTYNEPNATLDLSSGRPFQLRTLGAYKGAWLYLRHIAGAYLLSIEEFDGTANYIYSNLAAFSGNIDPKSYGVTILGNSVYLYVMDGNTYQPIVVKNEIGDYSQLVSQNSVFMSPIPGESVEVPMSTLVDCTGRSTYEKELYFHSVYVYNPAVTSYNRINTKIAFTDDTLQRKKSLTTYSNGVMAHSANDASRPTILTPSNFPTSQISSFNVNNNYTENFQLSIAGGSGVLANRTLTVLRNGKPDVTIANVFPANYVKTCHFTGNLYIFYNATTYMLVTYIDTSTWTLIKTFQVTGYITALFPVAANTLKAVFGASSGALSQSKLIDSTTGVSAAAVAYTAADLNFSYPDSTGTKPTTLNYQDSETLIWRGVPPSVVGLDSYAFAVRKNSIIDNLVVKSRFGEKYYFMQSTTVLRTSNTTTRRRTSAAHAIMPVSTINGIEPTVWSLQQYNETTAFLYESWPDRLKITPLTLYAPGDQGFVGNIIPVEPTTTFLLRTFGWINGG